MVLIGESSLERLGIDFGREYDGAFEKWGSVEVPDEAADYESEDKGTNQTGYCSKCNAEKNSSEPVLVFGWRKLGGDVPCGSLLAVRSGVVKAE